MLSVVLASGPGSEVEQTLAVSPFILMAAAAVVIAIGLAASLGPMLKFIRMRPVEMLRVDV